MMFLFLCEVFMALVSRTQFISFSNENIENDTDFRIMNKIILKIGFYSIHTLTDPGQPVSGKSTRNLQ